MLDSTRRDHDVRDEAGASDGEALHCGACGHVITTREARTEMSGAHEHTFVNPHGHVFRVGCFALAPGVVAVGPATHEFSWFPGFRWRVEVCGSCREHLGWKFGNGAGFHGLVVDRLVG